jgi:hypothetical protein
MTLLKRAEQLFAALNEMDLDSAVALIGPTADIRTPTGAFTGGKAYRNCISRLFRAPPDMRHEIRGIAVESDRTLAFEIARHRHLHRPNSTPRRERSPDRQDHRRDERRSGPSRSRRGVKP